MWSLNSPSYVWGKKLPNVDFTCVKVFKPDGDKSLPVVFATSMDKSIREL